ncbi:MAG TPA: polyprenyl synthetase family protein [Candidatus Limnocylindria bacterium]|nr:polyprenyl synthetase family protein [Candidatus Limnocylindria bacterium]
MSREARLEEIGLHLVGAGGKRIRPLVTVLGFHAAAGGLGTARRDDAIEVAVALELIHSATLLHDDIIDGSELRRGRASALQAFGLADTLVAGDFLFCRAFALCARFEAQVIRWAAEACVALTEGEMLQARFRRNPAVTLGDYHEIVDRKTAVLFATGARTAAYLAGADGTTVELLERAGHHLGMAFQMQDDLLDVDGSLAATGKPLGLDLRDGNPSLPIVLGIAADPELRALFALPAPNPAQIDDAIRRLRAAGVLETVREKVARELADGMAALAALPPSDASRALVALAQALATRAG